ncbi:hypothetical protein OUZ56_030633 [Daphnia magna]|uniref:Uncharacterized protein n=1 Tax=Daphnia magna TaxID=35525 RepID=A0ABQ9ZRX1_9CRUS|nr:hypothetical protein OUZ56_030633 [Daphnia magna]
MLCVAYCLLSFLVFACSASHTLLIQPGITNRKEWDNSAILIPPVLPSFKLTSTKVLSSTLVPSWFRTSTVLSTGRPSSIPTTQSHRQPRLEHSDQPMNPIIFITLGLAALIIIVILGLFLKNKCLKKRRTKRAPAKNEVDQVDCNNLVQSSSSVAIESEGDHSYQNNVASSSAPNPETIISPVYATVEFLPRCSIAEDYANTFRIAGFLEGDPIVYAEIETQKGD